MELKGRNAIITGAGGGIGSKIALAFAREGVNIALVDVRKESINPIALECKARGVKASIIAADITKEDGLKDIVLRAEKELGDIDILINNAGITVFKPIKSHTDKEVLTTIMLNVYAPIRLTQSVLSGMLRRGTGRVVNIGSMFGSLSFPYFGIYSASKYAIRGFSEALRRELIGTGVGVTYIAPRATKTSQSKEFFEMAERTGMNLDAPDKVASIVVDAVLKDRNEVYIGRPERFFAFLNKFIPSVIDKGLRKKIYVMAEYVK
ncbi:MAG: SDR family oxidoreductase [Deltaproteobacteria bacterium]|nr:SDR family oxidoreductase [Deltaproteobacteria bacterium]